jgi:ABC-type nitrate/sulfonate/bicarbonate transport system permease component
MTIVKEEVSARADAAGPKTRKATPRSNKRFSRKTFVIVTVLNLAVFFTIWELAPLVFDLPPLFLPRLSEVVAQIPELYSEGVLIGNVLISVRIYLVGMAIAIAVSIPLGLLLGGIKILDRIVSPYLWVIYTTPLLILMPLIILWVGFNETASVLLVIISAVPAIVVVVMEGVKTVDNSLLQAARSFGADRLRLFIRVILPSTIPFIGTGVKMGMSRGLIGLFVGEVFTSADGIGFIMEDCQKSFNVPCVYAMLLLFIAFSLVMVGLSQYFERKLSAWRSPNL